MPINIMLFLLSEKILFTSYISKNSILSHLCRTYTFQAFKDLDQ